MERDNGFLFDALRYLESVQRPALERLGEDPASKETIRTYGLALSIEVSEFVNEMNWKSWKDKEPDLARVADEFADILHFLGTWVCILEEHGLTPLTLVSAFAHKQQVNQQRLNGEVEHYGAPTAAPEVIEFTEVEELAPTEDGWRQFRIKPVVDLNGDTQLPLAHGD